MFLLKFSHLLLVELLLLNQPLVQLLSRRSLQNILLLIHNLSLNLQNRGPVAEDIADHRLRGNHGPVVSKHLRALIQYALEKEVFAGELPLTRLTTFLADFAPHVGQDDYVLEGAVAAELAEHTEVARRGSAHAEIRDTVNVDDAGELLAFLIPERVERELESSRLVDRWTHEWPKKSAIILRISVSLFVVSSKPGVSTRVTVRPSSEKGAATPMAFVQENNPLLIFISDPLTMLMNCTDSGRRSVERRATVKRC